MNVLRESGLRPDILKLEITESVLLSGVDIIEPVLIKWRKAGIKIALDDFGTGYSSLSYLLGLPFDLVKIDRSFVRAFHEDPRRKQIIRTIIELAKILDKRVVAEGVEVIEEEHGLQQMGCDFLQGCYFAKPMTARQVESFIEARSEVKAKVTSKRLLSVAPSLYGPY